MTTLVVGLDLAIPVDTRLRTLNGVSVYLGEVVGAVPLLTDGSGRVAPYLVQYPSPGMPRPDHMAGMFFNLDWSTQITCVAGYLSDCIHLAGRVHKLLAGWPVALSAGNTGRLAPPTGFDPGPIRRDDDVNPPRFYVPLQYQLSAAGG
jgi:hypothetical protein